MKYQLELSAEEFRVIQTIIEVEIDGYKSNMAMEIHPEERMSEARSIREKLAKLERENA